MRIRDSDKGLGKGFGQCAMADRPENSSLSKVRTPIQPKGFIFGEIVLFQINICVINTYVLDILMF